MQLFRDFTGIVPARCALTIGNFDGVHVGHQAMLHRVVAVARERGLVPAAMSFWPSPQAYFGRESPRIYNVRQMLQAFARAGIERVYLPRFNAALAKMDAEVFVREVLLRTYGTNYVLTGEDFRFGRNRAGDIWTLRAIMGDAAAVIDEVQVDGERVSSTRVRRALSGGQLDLAQRLLGQPFQIVGHIAHGDKLGRTLGFPTANIALKRAPAVTGVFAVSVAGIRAQPVLGVASVGVRPTVKRLGAPLAEVYLFNFAETIYGKRVAITFHQKLRDEEKYESVDAMTAQIHRDVDAAKRALAAIEGRISVPTGSG
jgi:riboflavin kinase / FMN adenylyltransferase